MTKHKVFVNLEPGRTQSYFPYPLLFLHGMKEWPLDLLLIGMLVVFISAYIYQKQVLAVLTCLGYVLGFIGAIFFNMMMGWVKIVCGLFGPRYSWPSWSSKA